MWSPLMLLTLPITSGAPPINERELGDAPFVCEPSMKLGSWGNI